MTRLETGHGAVCITEFGKGFRVPSNVADKRSQAWSAETNPIGLVVHFRMPVAIHQLWARWRLLLRLCTWDFLRCWQVTMEVARAPQLRSARQLQVRRERLEREALKLQEEQHVISQTAASASG
jgi:hypothetical protein